MKASVASELLPAVVAGRLNRIAGVARRSVLMECAARAFGVFVLLAVAAMLMDAALRLFHPAARWLVSLAVLTGLAVAGLPWWRRIRARHSSAAAARDAEESQPLLQERWSTLASLSSIQNPLLRGAGGLIEKVREEAARSVASVPLRSRTTRRRGNRALLWMAGGALALLLFHAADAEKAGVLWQRLAAPWSDASLTKIQVVSHPPDAVTPRHESCELQAAVSGRAAREAVLFLDQAGKVSEIPLSADRLGPVPFRHVLRDPVDDFAFRFRAGDGQTVWHRVRVADRPVIQAASVTVTPPAYTGQEPEKHPGIPSRLRVLEGARLTVKVAPGRSSDTVSLQMGAAGGRRPPSEAMDGPYVIFTLTVSESTRFFPLIVGAEGLENRMPPVCEVEMMADRPPVVTLAEDSAAEAITPADTIEVAFTASDDVGIHAAEVVITRERKGMPPREITVPIPLGADKGARNLSRRLPLDLSKLPLEPNSKISYAVRVRDGKAATAEAVRGERKEKEALANADAGTSKDGKDGGGKKDGEDGKDGKNNEPPVAMGKRELDLAGQCSCSASKNLEIEGYTGESPGFRDKKSLPVLPALTKIRDEAAAALTVLEGLRPKMKPGRAEASLLPVFSQAEGKTKSAEKECLDFTKLTTDTPYAMIGLDVESLRARDIAPAAAALAALPAAAEALPEADRAAMHLRSALAWLGRLMTKAEQAARQEAAAALAQKVKEMHRIFLEDTLKLLKLSSAKGAAVPELPLVEVSREYARLLEKREKAKAEIMKELAALLAKDPELMAKFTSNRSKGADALQVQVASLAAEQGALNLRTAGMAGAGAAAAQKSLTELRAHAAARQLKVAEELGNIMRGAVVWFPQSISRQHPAAVGFFDGMLRAASLPPDQDAERLIAVRAVVQSLDALGALNGGASWAAKQRAALESVRLQEEWLREYTAALSARRLPQAAGLLQRDLERRSRMLAAKVEMKLKGLAEFFPSLRQTAAGINSAFASTAIPAQSAAAGSLRDGAWKPAAPAQDKALKGLDAASKGCGELAGLVAEEMKKNPPPPPDAREVGDPPSLKSLLAMMEREAREDEDFSLPEWKMNVQLMGDWLSQCKSGGAAAGGEKPSEKPGEKPGDKPGEKPGDKPGEKPGEQTAPAMAEKLRAAAEQARNLATAAAKAQQAASEKAKALAGAEGQEEPLQAGTAPASPKLDAWNKLPSELSKDLRQQQDAPPPEEYRHAVETYFRRIGAGQDSGGAR